MAPSRAKSKCTVLAGVALLALTSGTAIAADLRAPVRKAPPPAPVVAIYNWTGFYIGAHVGGAWGKKHWADFESHDVSGFIAGGQIGFNWQAPGSNWVVGIEGQASWSNADGDHVLPGVLVDTTFRTKVEWLGTVAGRLGYAFDRVLVYAKGGFAFAHDKHEIAAPGFLGPAFFASGNKTRTGWMVGGGIEVALGGSWSAKGEYNYMDFGNQTVTFTSAPPLDPSFPIEIDQQIHVVKFGINYHFGGARY